MLQGIKHLRNNGGAVDGQKNWVATAKLLLDLIDALEKENYEIIIINHQIKSKCECQRVSLIVKQRLPHCLLIQGTES